MRFSISLLLVALFVGAGFVVAREWTDATGKFRIEAELVAVRNGKAILEKSDGSIISVPVDKLSPKDQEFLKAQDKKPGGAESEAKKDAKPATPIPNPSAGPAKSTGDALTLAKKTHEIFKSACYRCHGEDGTSEGGFNFVLNLEKVARGLTNPKQPAQSLLLKRLTAADDGVMPPIGEEPRPTTEELQIITAWIAAGGPSLPNTERREFVSNEQVVEHILADVRKQGERSRRFMRYFTLTHLYNAGVSADELQTYRNAFVKLINSLSWNTSLVIPRPVDPAQTVFGIDIRQLHWTGEMWQSLEEANPYFLRLETPAAKACFEETQTDMPYVRIDWFVFAASKPPLYHSMLAVPETDVGLEDMLRVKVQANIEQEQAIRAAFNRSGVSQNNRLIEWHKSPYGSYWKSYDFGGSAGQQNLFQYPLGPGSDGDHFQHDGGELIFTLPNGLQGYLLVDKDGKRIDQGPTSIVSDPKRPDKTVTNGVSCMSCHYTGVIPKKDEVGDAVRANRDAFKDADDILALYRESTELDAVFADDAKRFAEALKKIDINSLSRSGEPISVMAQRFEQDADLSLVASEFGLSPQEFLDRSEKASKINRAFSALRVPRGTMKRDTVAAMFSEAAVELRLMREASGSFDSSPKTATTAARTPAETPRSSTRPSRTGGDQAQSAEVARFPELGWGVDSLAFSPNGKLLAAGKMDRTILMFDVANKSQASSLEKLELLQSVKSCAFSSNGSRLVAAGSSGHISIYSVSNTGMLKEVGQFAGHSQDVTCLVLSQDGKFAISGGQEKKARYWEVESGRELATLPTLQGPVKAVHLSRNGRTAQITDGAALVEFDLNKRDIKRQRALTQSWASGQAAAFSPDGELVAVGDSANIRVWNTGTGKELPPLATNEIQWSMAFTPDGSRLLSGGAGKVNLWDVHKQQRVATQATAGTSYIQTLAVSADGKFFAAIPGSAGQDLQVFRMPTK